MSWLRTIGFFEGNAGKTWTASFTRWGEPDGAITYSREDRAGLPSGLGFNYNVKQQGGEWHLVNYIVPIIQTRCHFGGLRHWFICPLVLDGRPCERICRCLYLSGTVEYFGCRECHRLTYQSRVMHRDQIWEVYRKHEEFLERVGKKFKPPRGRKARQRREHRIAVAHHRLFYGLDGLFP